MGYDKNSGGVMKESQNSLKKLREKHGFSIRDMAFMLQISKSYYFQIEQKNRRLSYDMAKKISAIFGLKPDGIFYTLYKDN